MSKEHILLPLHFKYAERDGEKIEFQTQFKVEFFGRFAVPKIYLEKTLSCQVTKLLRGMWHRNNISMALCVVMDERCSLCINSIPVISHLS